MSNLPSLTPTTDLTESELKKIDKFMEDGLPGIATVTDSKLYRMLDLYLNGSTYSQISNTLEIKKIYVLYFAKTANWYDIKQNYLSEIQEKIKSRVVDSKLRSQEFMLLLVQAWQKKITKKLTKYLATEDQEHMEGVDLKEVAQLMKAIEMVNGLDSEGKDKNGKTPAVGLNIGSHGVDIQKTGDNTLSITPKEAPVGNLLQQLADERRNREKALQKPTITETKSDIINETGVKNENES